MELVRPHEAHTAHLPSRRPSSFRIGQLRFGKMIAGRRRGSIPSLFGQPPPHTCAARFEDRSVPPHAITVLQQLQECNGPRQWVARRACDSRTKSPAIGRHSVFIVSLGRQIRHIAIVYKLHGVAMARAQADVTDVKKEAIALCNLYAITTNQEAIRQLFKVAVDNA